MTPSAQAPSASWPTMPTRSMPPCRARPRRPRRNPESRRPARDLDLNRPRPRHHERGRGRVAREDSLVGGAASHDEGTEQREKDRHAYDGQRIQNSVPGNSRAAETRIPTSRR